MGVICTVSLPPTCTMGYRGPASPAPTNSCGVVAAPGPREGARPRAVARPAEFHFGSARGTPHAVPAADMSRCKGKHNTHNTTHTCASGWWVGGNENWCERATRLCACIATVASVCTKEQKGTIHRCDGL
jgi:hypothetical protein